MGEDCAGAASGTRTHDLFVTNEMLYQLSYCGWCRWCKAVCAGLRHPSGLALRVQRYNYYSDCLLYVILIFALLSNNFAIEG